MVEVRTCICISLKTLDDITYRYPKLSQTIPDSKDPRANMGPIWGRQDPSGPHVGPRTFVIWGVSKRPGRLNTVNWPPLPSIQVLYVPHKKDCQVIPIDNPCSRIIICVVCDNFRLTRFIFTCIFHGIVIAELPSLCYTIINRSTFVHHILYGHISLAPILVHNTQILKMEPRYNTAFITWYQI